MKFEIGNYGQERERNATEKELEIIALLCDLCGEDLRLVRKCDEYLTAVLGEWDICRIKYTSRAKWLMFPSAETKQKKHRIEDVDEVNNYTELLEKSITTAKKYGA